MRTTYKAKLVYSLLIFFALLVIGEGFLRFSLYWQTNGNKRYLFWGSSAEIQKLNPDYNKLPRWLPNGHKDFEEIISLRPGHYINQGNHMFRINNMGMIGSDISRKKPENLKRILILGDATTFVISEDQWPAELEKLLNRYAKRGSFRVLNGAYEGHNSFQIRHLFFQFRWLELEPDLLIIFSGIFDYQNLMWELMSLKPYTPFRWKRSLLKVGLTLSDRSLLYMSLQERVLRHLYGSVEKGQKVIENALSEPVLSPEEEARRKEKKRNKLKELSKIFTDWGKFSTTKAYQEWRGYFLKNIGEVIGAARERKIPVFLLKGPFIPGKDEPEGPFWWRYYPATIFTAIDELSTRYNAPSIDLYAHFRTIKDKRALYTWYWHGGVVHPSGQGARVIASRILNEIRNLGLFPLFPLTPQAVHSRAHSGHCRTETHPVQRTSPAPANPLAQPRSAP